MDQNVRLVQQPALAARDANASFAPVITVLTDYLHAVFALASDMNFEPRVGQQPRHVAGATYGRAFEREQEKNF